LHFAIRAAFLEEGIEIPFPQYDLHFRSEAPGTESSGAHATASPDRGVARARPGSAGRQR
jgi:small-conductance mechanosensitive channel